MSTPGEMVFSLCSVELKTLACFGLDLRDLVTKTELGRSRFPTPRSIRIAIHAGPVYVNFDPIVRQMTFTGAQISRCCAYS